MHLCYTKLMKLRGSKGFALPTILIVSVILMSMLVVAAVSVAGVRSNMAAQYYNQMAQLAAESGAAYARFCINTNGGVAQWSEANPLRIYTDCTGAPLSGLSECSSTSTNSACFVVINGNVKSSFSVGAPSIDGFGQYVSASSHGTVDLVRPSNNATWRTYRRNITIEL